MLFIVMDNFRFKKSYGQNFINDDNIIKNIVKKSNIKENSLVLEIGPGSGILTKELAKYAKNVLSYEIDNSLEEILDENLKDFHNLTLIFLGQIQILFHHLLYPFSKIH